MPQARLRALQQILQTLVERPEPRALVIACTDPETFYVLHLLDQLDEASPSDRFCVLADPFTTATAYADLLAAVALDVLDLPCPLAPELSPACRIPTILDLLLADLPAGPHHLVVALIPSEIHAPAEFSTLAHELLAASLDPRLRLVLRDDRHQPRHFHTAARSSSEQLFAYDFELPSGLLLAHAVAVTHDRKRPPAERALALIDLACQDLGHGRHADALARCEAVARLPVAAPLRALGLAIQADVLRRIGERDAAVATGLAALQLAVDSDSLPVVLHAALALGDLTRELGRVAEAAACYELAERASPLNPEVAAHARAQRDALTEVPC